MNYIWGTLIIVSILFSLINGTTGAFIPAMVDGVKFAVEVALTLILPGLAIWMGLTKIMEEMGLIHFFSKAFRPLVRIFFKNIPEGHPAATDITLNFLANVFGLGNAATPLGIRAMKGLQSLNKKKDTVSDDMMMFIVINTASIQLIPFSVITILAAAGSTHPQAVILPIFASTVISAIAAVFLLLAFRRMANAR